MRLVLVVPASGEGRRLALRPLGGIAPLRRLVRLAERAGFAPALVLADEGDGEVPDALAGTRALVGTRTADLDLGAETLLALDPAFVPERGALERAAAGADRPALLGAQGGVALRLPAKDAAGLLAGAASHADLLARAGRAHPDLPREAAPAGTLVTDEATRRRVEDALIRGLVKDTEGFMSRHVERPISLSISRRLMETRITPNQMTWVSLAFGVLGAACFVVPTVPWHVAGALLFLWHSILDGCDGELARLRLQESRWGGVLDFWGDNVVHAAVFLGLGVGWARAEGAAWPLAFSAAAVLGTFVSAGIVYVSTMRGKAAGKPLYQSVAEGRRASALSRVADALSRRDFIYLVVLLAALGRTHWFLVAAAVGAPLYALVLLWIRFGPRGPEA